MTDFNQPPKQQFSYSIINVNKCHICKTERMIKQDVEAYKERIKLGEQTSPKYVVTNDTCVTCTAKQNAIARKEADDTLLLVGLRTEYKNATEERKNEIVREVAKIKAGHTLKNKVIENIK